MLLAADVGNTNTVLGLFDNGDDEPIDHWRVATDQRRTADEWGLLIRQFLALRGMLPRDLSGWIIASVVPKVTLALTRAADRLGLDPLIVTWQTDTGVALAIDHPQQAGPDRIANVVAARELGAGPTVVVDLGTATTLDVVSADGAYAGGVILPGIEISLDALFSRAAALTPVDLVPPPSVVGTNTSSAVRSGATYGYAAQVDGLLERLESEIGPLRTIATGGVAPTIVALCRRVQHHDPWLTLRGLRLIHERNQS